jgi:hypothetical protein
MTAAHSVDAMFMDSGRMCLATYSEDTRLEIGRDTTELYRSI